MHTFKGLQEPTVVVVKLKSFLFLLTEYQAIKVCWGVEVQLHSFFDLGTRWELSASRHGRFTPRKRAPGAHWIGGWVGPRAVLDAVVK
jgi:hypothetical protein